MPAPSSLHTHSSGNAPENWLKTFASRVRTPIFMTIGLGWSGILLVVAQAWLLAHILNAVALDGQTLPQQTWRLLDLLIIFILRALLIFISASTTFSISAHIRRFMRKTLYEHIESFGPMWSRMQQGGELANTLVDGIESVEKYFSLYLPQAAKATLFPLTILFFIFPSDWISGLIMLLTAPLIPIFMILIGKGAEQLNQRQWKKLAWMSAHFLDMIEGLTTLKLFNASRAEAQVIARISDEYRKTTMSVLKVAFLSSLALEFLATLSIAMVAVLIGFRLLYGDMQYLYGFFILLLAPEFYLPLRNLGSQYHLRMEAIGAAERLVELMESTPTPQTAEWRSLKAGNVQILQFERMSFEYVSGVPVLQDLDFTIRVGEKVAIVGPSGAGKSTLLSLILGFTRPTTGNIHADGIPIHEVEPAVWLQQLSWVPQRPTIFHGSLLDNIRMGHLDTPIESIREAACLAHADEFINKLPQGYETVIGERGQGLSGGQIQRIALARAFLKNAPILLLDEPTSGLDMQNESSIIDAIERLAEGKTVLAIAHRLNFVRHMDRILVMNSGQLVESGIHEELLNQKGLYTQLCRAYRGAVS